MSAQWQMFDHERELPWEMSTSHVTPPSAAASAAAGHPAPTSHITPRVKYASGSVAFRSRFGFAGSHESARPFVTSRQKLACSAYRVPSQSFIAFVFT